MASSNTALTQLYPYETMIAIVVLSAIALGIGLKIYLINDELKKLKEEKK